MTRLPTPATQRCAYRGVALLDTGRHAASHLTLSTAAQLAAGGGDASYLPLVLTHLGRGHLLCSETSDARQVLQQSLELATSRSAAASMPAPESLLGHLDLADGNLDSAHKLLEHAFTLACQVDDPCWQSWAQRGPRVARRCPRQPKQRAGSARRCGRPQCQPPRGPPLGPSSGHWTPSRLWPSTPVKNGPRRGQRSYGTRPSKPACGNSRSAHTCTGTHSANPARSPQPSYLRPKSTTPRYETSARNETTPPRDQLIPRVTPRSVRLPKGAGPGHRGSAGGLTLADLAELTEIACP